ncbi:glycosyltransferase family 4 protein [Lachnoclostridium sp. An169]|uniref:glycosyltransferase family 4 protein n=1 Tax=Lachnoclostridium sp. An169 TaxID=1965569 RepID=UPI001FA91C11|nr:glycosyltransferase family 4 protein [Lachnoclostridium sp. An169]
MKPVHNDGKLNIAMLGHKRIPSREGGIEVVVEELSARMAALGHHVTCYNRKGHHVSGKAFDTKKTDSYKGVRLKSVFTIDKKGLAAMSASFFAALHCAFGNYDVVHFHAEGPCAMLWLPKLFGKRCVATIHGLDHRRAKWGKFASAYIMLGEKCAARFADEVIVLSRGVQDYFRKTYGRETVFVPNGVNRPVPEKAELITKKFELEKDSYYLYLGRLVPEKGLKYLIEAFKKVKTGKKLVIAGGSSDTDAYADELKELAKDDNRILFTGFVQGKLLKELYSNAYVYVLPSDLEGMPLSLLEAMSYGNCCLVSDIVECTEVVGDKAAVFKKGNSTDLARVLQKLQDEPETVRKYKDEAADYICGRYNWDEVTEKTLGLYENRAAEADRYSGEIVS